MSPDSLVFLIAIAMVAVLYSMVGHGGASGYLALMTLSEIPITDTAPIALVMNLLVAGTSFAIYRRSRHFDLNLAWPFIVSAAPLAFLGGSMKLGAGTHKLVLAVVLGAAAIALFVGTKVTGGETQPPKCSAALLVGALIGLLSGVVGIGGGVFLGPVMILSRWADAKTTAAVSAVFILVNSAAGLLARPPDSVRLAVEHWPMLAVGLGGALVGSWLGAQHTPNPVLRRVLAATVLVAAAKLVIT
ncbi:MAG: sulfite exporter TauE/SafE family protein [Methanoregulaceae archaeon]|nr:sulfite exporter TauE/SafE family protein [Methanoregulaceae archaeon]